MSKIEDIISRIIDKMLEFFLCKILRIKLSDEKKSTLSQFVKFGIVGVFNNAIFYIVYLLLVEANVHYLIASVSGFTISVFNAYYWNNKYVFGENGNRKWWITFFKTYISYAGTGIILSNILLMMWVELIGMSKILAPFLNLIITVPINFIVNKFWAYKNIND